MSMCQNCTKSNKFPHNFIVDRIPWRLHPDRRGALARRLRDIADQITDDTVTDDDIEALARVILPLARRVGWL